MRQSREPAGAEDVKQRAAFRSSPRRDAWGAIRGFAFQIDRTIEAWIGLRPGTALECEAGEDIDFVSEFASNLETPQRLLEQVKHRQRRLTLRTPSLIEAIANFLLHVEQNPDIPVRFRYLTNALTTTEQGISWPEGGSGVEWWQRLGQGEAGAHAASAADEIWSLLRAVSAKAGTGSALGRFLNTASTDDLRTKLIEQFEISPGHLALDELGAAVRERLIACGLAIDVTEASTVYDRLFLAVLRVLERPGAKRLDRTVLDREIANTDVRSSGQTMARFAAQLNALVSQVLELEARVESVEELIASDAMSRLLATAIANGSALTQLHGQAAIDTTPLVPAYDIDRPILVADLVRRTRAARWFAVTGSAGVGKTQLARAIGAMWDDGPVIWISVSGRSQDVVDLLRARLRQTVLAIGYEPREIESLDVAELVDAIRDVEGGEPLIVLDDLGRTETSQDGVRLASLARHLAGRCHSLSTSQHFLPSEVRLMLGEALDETASPLFSVNEIRQLLASAGAPAAMLDGTLPSVIHGLTSGHPALVGATALWMSRHLWVLDSAALASLLSGGSVSDLQDEARDRVRRVVDSPDARTLLDRLSLAYAPFNGETVDAAGSVEPPLLHPRELLLNLSGPWIANTRDGRFEVSPLLRNIGRKHLSRAEQLAVHRAFADVCLLKGPISPDGAFEVCMQYASAEAWLRLAEFYVQALLAVSNSAAAKSLWWARHYFPLDRAWPREVPHAHKILVRALQVRRQALAGEDWRPWDESLDALIASSSDSEADQYAIAIALFHAKVTLEERSPYEKANSAISLARILRRHGLPTSKEFEPEGLWWSGAVRARTAEDYRQLISSLDSMTSAELQVIFSDAAVTQAGAAVVFFDGLGETEAESRTGDQDWRRFLDELERLAQLAHMNELRLLEVVFARCRAIVKADRLRDVDAALSELSPYRDAPEAWVRFIARWTLGRVLETHGRPDEALLLLRDAADIVLPAGWRVFATDVHEHRMIVAAALGITDEAIQSARSVLQARREFNDECGIVDQLTELGWLRWMAGDRRRALAAFVGALARLGRALRKDQVDAIASSWKLGHTAGWCGLVASTGAPPPKTAAGDPYVSPVTGFTLRDFSGLEKGPMGIGPIYFTLGLVALHIKNLKLARKLFASSATYGDEDGALVVSATAQLRQAALESWFGNYQDAVRLAAFWSTNLASLGGPASTSQPEAMERSAFGWHVLWPALVRLLENGTDESNLEQLADLRACIEAEEFRDRRGLTALADATQSAFSNASANERIEAIRNLDDTDTLTKTVLYVAACTARGADLSTVALLQAIVLDAVERFVDGFVIDGFGRWLCGYWGGIIATDSFRVSHPRLLRSALDELRGSVGLPQAARLLLDIQVAVGARFDVGIRRRLTELANEPRGIPEVHSSVAGELNK